MKGADQCPKCASRRWGEMDQPVTDFYARRLLVCANCGTAWEPFDEAALLDAGDRRSSFREPCNNCAFRPGSNEQKDPEKWKGLMAQLDVDKDGGTHGQFFCHKGVPIDLHHETLTKSGFAYPCKDGKADSRKLRLCRGYLMMVGRKWDRIFKTDEAPSE